MSANPYLEDIRANLPRLLALFDSDPTSASYGMGDRYHWAWGLIDFGNGTFQGAAHGLARLWKHGLWPYPTPRDAFIRRIDTLFRGAARLTRPDGSLEEAFPREGSYCVTALVAFDLLCALELLHDQIAPTTRARWQATVAPMMGYLLRADETHAIISNHLATAVAALVRWHRLTPDPRAETRGRQLLDRILQHQSDEGWFSEYQGADPGYQSLCVYYLADVHRQRPDWALLEPLRRSFRFLWHFAHPDGSFGGLYGSRCTRFYYPAGALALADQIPEAAALTDFMAHSIAERRVVTLSAIDEPNLTPTFNAYCWAASLTQEQAQARSPVGHVRSVSGAGLTLPALSAQPDRHHYPQAGLLIDRGPNHYSIIATRKGGAVYHFVNCKQTILDAGVVIRDPQGHIGSSQTEPESISVPRDQDQLTVLSRISPMPKQLPNPWQFLVLRLLSVSAFRIPVLREWVKQRLVQLLITGAKPWPASNHRTIQLGENLSIRDETELPSGYELVADVRDFVPIHMASQGYWQIQDESRL